MTTATKVRPKPDTREWPVLLDEVRDLIQRAKEQYESLPHPDDVLNTPRAQADAWTVRNVTYKQLSLGTNGVTEAERRLGEKASMVDWHTLLQTTRDKYAAAILALPGRAADRSPEQERELLALKRSILQIDRGVEYSDGCALLAGPLAATLKAAFQPTWDGPRDPWAYGFGSLPETEDRLAEVEERLAKIRADLVALLRWEAAPKD